MIRPLGELQLPSRLAETHCRKPSSCSNSTKNPRDKASFCPGEMKVSLKCIQQPWIKIEQKEFLEVSILIRTFRGVFELPLRAVVWGIGSFPNPIRILWLDIYNQWITMSMKLVYSSSKDETLFPILWIKFNPDGYFRRWPFEFDTIESPYTISFAIQICIKTLALYHRYSPLLSPP